MKTLTFVCLFSLLYAHSEPIEDQLSYQQGYAFVMDQKWDQAIDYFNQFLKANPSSEWSDDASFWICFSNSKKANSSKEAFECYRTFITNYPESNWADDAMNHMAQLADQLEEQGHPEYQDILVEIYDQDDEPVSADQKVMLQILASLGDIGDKASVDTILEQLENPDPIFRARLIRIMEDVEDPRITKTLIQKAAKDPSEKVRAVAVEALGDMDRNPEIDAFLIKLAKDESQSLKIRVVAINALEDREIPGIEEVFKEIYDGSKQMNMREAVIEALGDQESHAAVMVLTTLFNQQTDEDIKIQILGSLADTEHPAAFEFISKLAQNGEDSDTTREAIEALDEFEQSRTVLLAILDSKAPWRNKAVATHTLADLEGAGIRNDLAHIVSQNHPPAVKIAAIEGLGERDEEPEVVDILENIFKTEKDPIIQKAVVEALGDLGTQKARQSLLKLLKQKMKTVQGADQ